MSALALYLFSSVLAVYSFTVTDVLIPESCDVVAKASDHVLLEFFVSFANGTRSMGVTAPQAYSHVLMEEAGESPVFEVISTMCAESTRRITWDLASGADMKPLQFSVTSYANFEEPISMDITVHHITSQAEYLIFDSFKKDDFEEVANLIDSHIGINAVDYWGQTPLMISSVMGNLPIVAALLNTRMPKVNVNMAKPSGFTALFYAVEHKQPTILGALLRRGADPNAVLQQEGAKGNTALHFACLDEKTKHVELLLEYGANPTLTNEFGKTAYDMVPAGAMHSTQLYYRSLFQTAYERMQPTVTADKLGAPDL